MKKPIMIKTWKNLLAPVLIAAVAIVVTGCQTTAATAKAQAAGSEAKLTKSAAQVWAENCARCHNVRSPSEFSDTQWEAASLHMRVRAGLTAQEHTAILSFLKSAN